MGYVQYDARKLGMTDSRYVITGAKHANAWHKPQFAVYFCGRLLAVVDTPAEAVEEAIAHADDRLAPRTRGVMQAARVRGAAQGVRA